MTTAVKLEEYTDLLNGYKLLKKACLQDGRSYTAHITSASIVQPSVQVPKVLGAQDTKTFRVQVELLCLLPLKSVQCLEGTCANYK
jgi:hypothetical protein